MQLNSNTAQKDDVLQLIPYWFSQAIKLAFVKKIRNGGSLLLEDEFVELVYFVHKQLVGVELTQLHIKSSIKKYLHRGRQKIQIDALDSASDLSISRNPSLSSPIRCIPSVAI